MGYVLVWMLTLAGLAGILAGLASLNARGWNRLSAATGFFAVYAALALPLIAAAVLAFRVAGMIRPSWLFAYTGSLAAAYLALGIGIWIRARRRVGDKPRAAGRPAGWLLAAAVAILILDGLCLKVMENQVAVRAAAYADAGRAQLIQLSVPWVPDDQNAKYLYRAAGEKLNPPPAWLDDAAQPGFDPTDPETAADLARYRSVVDLLVRAGRRPAYHSEPNLFRPAESPLEPFRRNEALLLLAQLKHDAAAQRPAAAWRSLSALAGMAEHFYRQPMLIHTMQGVVFDDYAHQGLEYALAQVDSWPKHLLAGRRIQRTDRRQYVRRALRAEMAGLVVAFEIPWSRLAASSRMDDRVPAWQAALETFPRVFLLPADLDAAPLLLNFDRSGDLSWTGRLAAVDRLNRALREQGGLLTRIGMFQATGYLRRTYRAEAQNRLSRLAWAAAAFRAETGRWPNHADELVPTFLAEIPTDPFFGRALSLTPSDGGLILGAPLPSTGASGEDEAVRFYLGSETWKAHRLDQSTGRRR